MRRFSSPASDEDQQAVLELARAEAPRRGRRSGQGFPPSRRRRPSRRACAAARGRAPSRSAARRPAEQPELPAVSITHGLDRLLDAARQRPRRGDRRLAGSTTIGSPTCTSGGTRPGRGKPRVLDEPDRHERRARREREPRGAAVEDAVRQLLRGALREDPEHLALVQQLAGARHRRPRRRCRARPGRRRTPPSPARRAGTRQSSAFAM